MGPFESVEPLLHVGQMQWAGDSDKPCMVHSGPRAGSTALRRGLARIALAPEILGSVKGQLAETLDSGQSFGVPPDDAKWFKIC